MNYPDSVRFLYALGNEMKSAKLGLERIDAIMAALGIRKDAYRVIHVAGTNGKGSTCAMIDAGLQAAGIRTGLFTSPHLGGTRRTYSDEWTSGQRSRVCARLQYRSPRRRIARSGLPSQLF